MGENSYKLMLKKGDYLRKRIFEIIEIAEEDDKLSSIYDTMMMFVIILSLIPLAFKNTNILFEVIEKITVADCKMKLHT